ncbi:MAG: PilZ domain-containing protein [Nitrospirae bacterium]|nr:MAG: PilZ domain-containing protein [Nitrospirota bacterium]
MPRRTINIDRALHTEPGREVCVIHTTNDWDWPISASNQKHNERVALLRQIPYELTAPIEPALSVNISSGGMLLVMQQAPGIEQVLKVHVPTPTSLAETPTLAEVRWTRKIPFGRQNGDGLYFVGLKFMF